MRNQTVGDQSMVGGPVSTRPHSMHVRLWESGGLHVALCRMGLKVRHGWRVDVRGATGLLQGARGKVLSSRVGVQETLEAERGGSKMCIKPMDPSVNEVPGLCQFG